MMVCEKPSAGHGGLEREAIVAVGENTGSMSPAKVREIVERISDAILGTGKEVRLYMKRPPEFFEIGKSLLREWEAGPATSLRG